LLLVRLFEMAGIMVDDVDDEDEVKFHCLGFQILSPTEDRYPTKCA